MKSPLDVEISSSGLGVMTSRLHREGRWFDSTLEYTFGARALFLVLALGDETNFMVIKSSMD